MEVRIAELSEAEIRQAVATHLGSKNFELVGFEIRKASENALGFLGDHFRIRINILVEGAERTLQYFAKSVPCKNLAHYDYTIKTGAFYKEIELYKTLFRDMAEATKFEHQKWLPEFYYSRASELLILEDLALDGFYMYPERTLLDLEHSKKAVEIMAVMHAASLIFEEKLKLGKAKTRSKKFQNGADIGVLYPNLIFETEASDVKGHPGNLFWEAGFRSQVPVIDVLPDYTDDQRKVMKENIIEKLRLALKFVKPSKKFRNVLLHGDLWTNNLLFRKDKEGNVSEAMIIDFQLGRFGPPAHDLLMFFYLTNTRQFRDQHLGQLLELYYETLAKELQAEDLDISVILSKEEFQESIEYYREYAILNNVMYFQIVYNPADLCNENLSSSELFHKNQYEDRSELIIASFRQDEVVRSRMTESMRELAEFYDWA